MHPYTAGQRHTQPHVTPKSERDRREREGKRKRGEIADTEERKGDATHPKHRCGAQKGKGQRQVTSTVAEYSQRQKRATAGDGDLSNGAVEAVASGDKVLFLPIATCAARSTQWPIPFQHVMIQTDAYSAHHGDGCDRRPSMCIRTDTHTHHHNNATTSATTNDQHPISQVRVRVVGTVQRWQ